jgi:phosphohistidine phosphatase
MKQLIILRHAKSSWENAALTDFDRTLNQRGIADVTTMAQRLQERKIAIDVFIASTARRARTTAELFIQAMQEATPTLLLSEKLYQASAATLLQAVKAINDQYQTAAIVAHNPGITNFVNALTTNLQTDNMPTCGMFGINITTTHWREFEAAEKTFLFYDYPKNFLL